MLKEEENQQGGGGVDCETDSVCLDEKECSPTRVVDRSTGRKESNYGRSLELARSFFRVCQKISRHPYESDGKKDEPAA